MSVEGFTFKAGNSVGIGSEEDNCEIVCIGFPAIGPDTKWVRLPIGVGGGLCGRRVSVVKHYVDKCVSLNCKEKHSCVATSVSLGGKRVRVMECGNNSQFYVFLDS